MKRADRRRPDAVSPSFLPGSRAHRIYNVLLAAAILLGFPLWLPWMLLSGKRRRNFLDRIALRTPGGIVPEGGPRVWIHAVSVGETLAAVPLVRGIRRRMPDARILFSTVTVTGQETAGKAIGKEADLLIYFPFDLPCVCNRFLDRLRPDVVGLLETEVWPNFIAACAGRGIPVLILNGRISARSFRGYMRFRFLFRNVLSCVSAIAAQTQEDARRYVALRGRADGVVATGNMKFDVAPPAAGLSALAGRMSETRRDGAAWFVAGSTHRGEEEAVLRAYGRARAVQPSLRLLLAPRHPERFGEAEAACAREGFPAVRKSALEEDGPLRAEVVLLDTVGELLSAYASADFAFVGGSLVPVGGHNILEPALFGVPTVVGPHMENFREIAGMFGDARAVERAEDAEGLARVIAGWAGDPARAKETGRRAQELLAAFRGATDRNVTVVAEGLGRIGKQVLP